MEIETLKPRFMFNLEEDLYEQDNLIGKPEVADIQADLTQQLSAWKDRCTHS